MTKYLVDGKTPGQFRARCNLTVAKLEKKLTVEERQEAKEKGLRRSFDRDHRNNVRWFVHFPQCGGFETTDRAAFVEHMRTVHGKTSVTGIWESFARSVRAGWRPTLTTKRDIVAANGLKTCPTCGLVAEVGERAADVLWWDEHERGCAVLQAAKPRVGNCIQVGHNYSPHPETDHCMVFTPVAESVGGAA